MDIATLVKHVLSAFDDAASLVKRIRDRDGADGKPLPEEPTKELLESLSLGPVIVRGHYVHDLKRFGEQYACGDIQARDAMKDVLIQLQMALITHLRTVWMDNMDLDFSALQSSSDDCRVNAGVCLGQLSQRLSDAAKAQAMYPHNMMSSSGAETLMPPLEPSLQYSSSRSTVSSRFSRPLHPQTPDSTATQFAATSAKRTPTSQESQKLAQAWDTRQEMRPLPSIIQPYPRYAKNDGDDESTDIDTYSTRRASSTTLAREDVVLLSPIAYVPEKGPAQRATPLPGAQEKDGDSVVSNKSQEAASPLPPGTSGGQQDGMPVSSNSHGHENGNSHSVTNASGQGPRQPAVYEVESLQPKQSVASFNPRTLAAASNNRPEYVQNLQRNARPPALDPLGGQWPTPPSYAPPHRSQLPALPFQELRAHPTVIKRSRPPQQYRTTPLSTTKSRRAAPDPELLRQLSLRPLPPDPPPTPKSDQARPLMSAPTLVKANESVKLTPRIHPDGPINPSQVTISSIQYQQEQAATTKPSNQPSIALLHTTSTKSNSTQTSDSTSNSTSQVSSVPSSTPLLHHHQPPPPTNDAAPDHPPHAHSNPDHHSHSTPDHHSHAPPEHHSHSTPDQHSHTTPDQHSHSHTTPDQHSHSHTTPDEHSHPHSTPGHHTHPHPPPTSGPLSIPTEKSPQGFCKGAARLLIDPTQSKKAFSVAARPAGLTGTIQFWKCVKCHFEGPLHATVTVPPGKKSGKTEKSFDPKIRVALGDDEQPGVRYKWIFLAKCHVGLKSMPDAVMGGAGAGDPGDGTFGAYRCVFCVAEGKSRGWDASATVSTDGTGAASNGSIRSGGTDAAQVFGTVDRFMDHLALHRRQEWWPCAEMAGRLKCVLGRVAEAGEEWDVNFLPVSGEEVG